MSLIILSIFISALLTCSIYAGEELEDLRNEFNHISETGSALPSAHPLSVRFKDISEECRDWIKITEEVSGRKGWEEDTRARSLRLREAVHRLGMMELRTRIVQKALERGEREPDYGILASYGLERITNHTIPGVEATNRLSMAAAAGERISFRLPLIIFDRGITMPDFRAPFPGVKVEKPFTSADGEILPEKIFSFRFEDEAPTDAQRIMFGDYNQARGIQRTDYMTGASQDCIIYMGGHNYIMHLHANTSHSIRVIANIPAGQKPGTYKGSIMVWPRTEDYPEYAEITIKIVDAGGVPAPYMKIKGGFNVESFLYMTAAKSKKGLEEIDKEQAIRNHINSMARRGIILEAVHLLEPDKGFLFVPDEPDGPLALTAKPLSARLLAWQAWAQGRQGIQVASFHDWTDSWNRMHPPLWPGNRGYNNYVKDENLIGSLIYSTGHDSLRLLMLEEGLQDAAWLQRLKKETGESGRSNKWKEAADGILSEAEVLAGSYPDAKAERLLEIREKVLLHLSES